MAHLPVKRTGEPTAPRGSVYLAAVGRVNSIARAASPWRSLLALSLIAAVSGCRTAPLSAVPRVPYPVTMRYDVEPTIVAHGYRSGLDAIEQDFEQVAQLGFNSVALQHVDPSDRIEVNARAQDAGLLATNPDSARGDIQRKNSHRRPHETNACVLDVGIVDSSTQSSIVEAWLRQYHKELAAGHTAGLLFDRYRRLPGSPGGFVRHDRSPLGSELAAIKQITDRATRWGACLHGAKVISPDEPAASAGLSICCLARGSRRFVLVRNTSPDRFKRGPLTLPPDMMLGEVARAIEIPPTSARPVGAVRQAERGRITLDVELRPGDGALFEIFARNR